MSALARLKQDLDDERRLEELEHSLLINAARKGDVLAFTKLTKPDYEVNWHHRLLADKIDRFLRKEIRFLMVFMPPRFGKSELTSRRLPALIHGLYPNDEILAASYNADFASNFTVDVQRIVDHPSFHEIFPTVRIPASGGSKGYARNSQEHEIMPWQDPEDGLWYWHRGSYRSSGVGGSLTGFGGNWCFPKEVCVLTSSGYKSIADVEPGDLVWSYDHERNEPKLCRVNHVFTRDVSELVSVKTTGGRSFLSTPEHPVFTKERGYWAASDLSKEGLIVAGSVHEDPSHRSPPEMLEVRDDLLEDETRLREGPQTWAQRLLLFCRLFEKPSRCEEPKGMFGLWATRAVQITQVLFRLLPSKSFTDRTKKLSDVRHLIPAAIEDHEVLFDRLQEPSPFQEHSRDGESELRRSGQLSSLVSKASGTDQTTRRASVPDLSSDKGANGRSSYQRGQARQSSGEPRDVVSFMSCDPPQIDNDTVSSVERISGRSVRVYDLEVEGSHNFFANGILVHNCILDDLIKNRADADSPAYRESMFKWYTSTVRTRLEKHGSILMTLTRWHDDDLPGRLLRLAKSDPNADQWNVITLPAIRESLTDDFDPRLPGEALWPNKYDLKELMALKANSSRDWASLYQQSPMVEGGNIVKADWIKYYKVRPTKFDRMIISWDFAVKDKKTSDYAVGGVYGANGANVYLVDQVRGQWDFPRALDEFVKLCRKYPNAHKKLVEAKAVGPAIVQTLKSKISGIVEVEPRGDKVARMNAVAPMYESGNVWYPDPEIAPWINDHLQEMCRFPHGVNDDRVDSESQALDELRKSGPIPMPMAGYAGGY